MNLFLLHSYSFWQDGNGRCFTITFIICGGHVTCRFYCASSGRHVVFLCLACVVIGHSCRAVSVACLRDVLVWILGAGPIRSFALSFCNVK